MNRHIPPAKVSDIIIFDIGYHDIRYLEASANHVAVKPMNERRHLKLDIRKEHQEIQPKFEVLVCIVQCHYCFLVDYFSPVFLLFPFLPSHNCVERFDLVADNNTIVCPYKDTSWYLICLCLNLKKGFCS